MDEDRVSFGPERETRLPLGRRRALAVGAAGVIAAGVIAAGVAVTLVVAGQHHGAGSPPAPAAGPAAATAGWLPVTCTPGRAATPSLAGIPAGMRPGALRVIIAGESAGHCTVDRTGTPAG